MIKSIKAITFASYLSMLFLGVATVIVGASARNINLSPFEIGLLLALQNLGFMAGVMISGAMADTHSKTRILFIGSLVLAFSLFTFYATGGFWLNVAIMVLIGAGVGSYEGVTDALLIDLHPKRQSLHININHFFVTFGSILLTIYLIFLDVNWRRALVQSAIVVLLLAGFYALAVAKRPTTTRTPYMKRVRILSSDRLVVSLFIVTVLLVGVELGTVGILTTYLTELRDFTETSSKVGLLLFLVGIAIGRIVVGLISRSDRINRLLLILFGSATLIFSFLYIFNVGQWLYGLIFAAGISIAGLFPLIITLAGQIYPEMSGTVIGSIKVAIPIGGIVIPALMSFLSRQYSFYASLLLFPLALFIAFMILFFKLRQASLVERAQA